MLPFWVEVFATPVHPQRSCDACMTDERTTDLHRQLMRCGRLPAVASVGSFPSRGYPVPDSTYTTEVCPTYTVSLPEVQEVAQHFGKYKAGYLAESLDAKPSPWILDGFDIYERAMNARDRWRMEQDRKAAEVAR